MFTGYVDFIGFRDRNRGKEHADYDVVGRPRRPG